MWKLHCRHKRIVNRVARAAARLFELDCPFVPCESGVTSHRTHPPPVIAVTKWRSSCRPRAAGERQVSAGSQIGRSGRGAASRPSRPTLSELDLRARAGHFQAVARPLGTRWSRFPPRPPGGRPPDLKTRQRTRGRPRRAYENHGASGVFSDTQVHHLPIGAERGDLATVLGQRNGLRN